MIQIKSIEGFTTDEELAIGAAIGLGEKVLKHPDFIAGIKAIGDTDLEFRLLELPIGLKLKWKRLWNPFSKELAATGRDGTIYLNRNSFKQKYGAASLAGTLAHEHMHVLGYGHGWLPTSKRAQSIPYVVGDIACMVARGLV